MITAGLLPPICCAHVSMASDHLNGEPLEIVTPSDPILYTEPVEDYSEVDYVWADLEAFLLTLLSNPR